MTVAEFPSPQGPASLARTPPQDIAAEQSVLGGMLLSKDAIADVVEAVRGHDFYRPAHELVYEAVLDLYGRGEPADAVTVSAELQKRGELSRVGGAPYLHTLISSVPTAANAGYYARIVRETAILRRLIEAGTKIVQLGYTGDGDADEIVDAAQAEVYNVTDRRTSDDYLPLSAIMEGTLDEIEAIGSRGGEMVGVPTGFADFDELTNGLHPGQMIVVAARPAVGKALALDTPLATPEGWTTMGEVTAGDQLMGADGLPTTVRAVTEVLTDRPCYEVEFSDGTVIVADGQHQWLTDTRASRRSQQEALAAGHHQRTLASVRTTHEIARTLRVATCADNRLNHTVRNARPMQLPTRQLSLQPYALGVWLGDGHSAAARLTSADPEIAMYLEADGLRITPGSGPLGVLGDKHIPADYLRASEEQRRLLLAGLLDTDGTITAGGSVQFAVTSRRLAEDTRELIVSLGYKCGLTTKRVRGRSEDSSTCYILTFASNDDVFRLERKRIVHKERRSGRDAKIGSRYITAVRPVDSVPVRCVEVDNDSHLYLAGRTMIPTHNSTLGLDIARAAAIKANMATCVFSLEMSRNEITMRLLSAEARVALHHMRTGKLTDDDWTRLARRMGEVSNAPLFIDDSPNMSMMEIRAKCRRLKQRHDLKLVIIDYLQLMSSGKRVESRQQEVSEFSRAIKLLAKELEVPVIAISQLNRGSEQRTDKKPQMSDLRESGCLPASTRIMRADTGAEVTLGELMAAGARDVPVWSLNERLQFVPRTMTHVFSSGVKEVFRLRLASGREIEATANHPFLTYGGWKPLGELSMGDRLAIARHVPQPLDIKPGDPDEIVLLAHLIGDGSFVRRQPIRYASIDEANLNAVAEAALRRFGITGVRDEYPAARVTSLRLPAPYHLTHGKRNPIAAWLDGMGLFGLRSHEKFVPSWVFSLPKDQVALFLRHLWATDGCVHWYEKLGWARIYYASTSRRLVDDVARLLLRFNIAARVKVVRKTGYRDCYQLLVMGTEQQKRFIHDIGVHGARGIKAADVVRRLEAVTPKPNIDTIPSDVWNQVRQVMTDKGMTGAELASKTGFRVPATSTHSVSRSRLARMAAVLDSAELDVIATNDVLWDSVTSIELLGFESVFDATVIGTHNFLAEGIALHNSIEQDADMVVLLHREELYERESPRAGEADFIVAKHRNGPTATITVAFQGHYSRFVDMAQS